MDCAFLNTSLAPMGCLSSKEGTRDGANDNALAVQPPADNPKPKARTCLGARACLGGERASERSRSRGRARAGDAGAAARIPPEEHHAPPQRRSPRVDAGDQGGEGDIFETYEVRGPRVLVGFFLAAPFLGLSRCRVVRARAMLACQ